jgi:predicted nucleic acid-binding protein
MASARRESRQAPQRLILDSGAVIALARGDQRARAFLARALELGVPIEIPVVVVAETVRGGPRDAPVHRVLKAVGSVPDAREVHGRTAGQLLGTARSSGTVDALVVAQAVVGGGAHVLTGDR